MVAQNGYGNYEKAIRLFGKGKVILSRGIFGAKLLEWGHVRITGCGDDVVIGDPSGSMVEGFLKDLAKLFSKAGFSLPFPPFLPIYYLPFHQRHASHGKGGSG